jgi:hypothetical protein
MTRRIKMARRTCCRDHALASDCFGTLNLGRPVSLKGRPASPEDMRARTAVLWKRTKGRNSGDSSTSCSANGVTRYFAARLDGATAGPLHRKPALTARQRPAPACQSKCRPQVLGKGQASCRSNLCAMADQSHQLLRPSLDRCCAIAAPSERVEGRCSLRNCCAQRQWGPGRPRRASVQRLVVVAASAVK